MNEVLSYLLVQARYRPVAAGQFAAGELWRRGRMRIVNSLDAKFPEFATGDLRARFAAFLPANASNAAAFARAFPRAADAAIAEAEATLRHEFLIFGKRFEAGAEIDWHRDWEANYRWPAQANGNLRIAPAAPGVDVKRPWELARFHHLLDLGKAHLLTQDARFAAEFAAEVRHFLRENPYPHGIHWAMPMEAAIRAINWTTAAAFFAQSDALDEKFWREFLHALLLHGRYVAAHQEWNPVARGNHYLSCVAGLVFLGAVFADCEEARDWLAIARRELVREMATQVHEDGVAHEGSTAYHAFLTELLLSSALVLTRHDARAPIADSILRAAMTRSCGVEFVERLEKMFSFLAALVTGRQQPSILGDTDGGRVLPFCSVESSALRHLLAVGRSLFARKDWPQCEHACEESWWRLGSQNDFHTVLSKRSRPEQENLKSEISHSEFEISNVKSQNPNAKLQIPNCVADHAVKYRAGVTAFPHAASSHRATREAFPDAGFFFFSSRHMRGSVRCGPLGVNGWANHAHCDQLSLEFCWAGRPVVVDPGTYLYNGDAAVRNLFRSTRYHNSVVVNGEEQNRFWPGLLFRMVDDTRSRLLRWEISEERVEFAGEHRGYERLPEEVRVRRELSLNRNDDVLRVCDSLRGTGRARLEWNWRFAPDIVIEQIAKDSASALSKIPVTCGKQQNLLFLSVWRAGPVILRVWTPADCRRVEIVPERGWIAPRYGHRQEAPVLRVSVEAGLPATIVSEFAPWGGPDSPVENP